MDAVSESAGPLDVECGKCHQPPGERCVTKTGNPVLVSFHRERLGFAPRHHGRRANIDPALTDTICALLEKGVPLVTAAASAGLSSTNVFRWLQMADDPTTPYQEEYRTFRDRVVKSRAQGAVTYVNLLHDAAKGGQVIEESVRPTPDGDQVTTKYSAPQPRAAEFMLERSFAKDWGRRQTLMVGSMDELDPMEAARIAAQEVPGMENVGIDKLLTNIARFKQQKAIEAEKRTGEDIVDAVVVDQTSQ